MIFQDNILKKYLENVYFITGTPCGGKTTISRALSEKHGVPVYDIDERFPEHQQLSNPTFQPAMNKKFQNADEFFGRTVAEYKKWLIDNTREQLEFVLFDLIRLSQSQIVLCDCHLTLDEAERLSDRSRVVFLIKNPSDLTDDYCNRADHQNFRNFIYSATDVEKAKRTCNETLRELNIDHIERIKNSPYFWLERTAESRIEQTLTMVEQHFQW